MLLKLLVQTIMFAFLLVIGWCVVYAIGMARGIEPEVCVEPLEARKTSEPNSTLQKGGDEHLKTTLQKFRNVDHKAQKASKEAEYKQLQEEEH